ncbi:MAG TPA: helix-turn-helix domain-containing protein [Jatrophihabitans sp.]|nr:helix-turn-helix domain-containing protein [Jatrophihabitans sp.]
MRSADSSNDLDRLLQLLPVGRSVGIAEPGMPPEPGELLLAVTGADAAELIAAATRAGAAAVVLPAGTPIPPVPGSAAHPPVPGSAAHPPVIAQKPDRVSWRQLHAALAARLDQPRLVAGDELADLAQTIATLTGGLVTIEDTAARVLAYSRSSDEVDELRRLSILGRSGPADYLALLREWGVYDRLATPEEVVEIAEHPASGVRRRLAVGVFAGERQLGTIWVQQGATEFGPHARQALLGAARLTAGQLLGRDERSAPARRLTDLLAGRITPAALGLGRDADRPCAVAIVQPGVTDAGPAEQAQRLAELRAIVTVQAAAFRRHSLVEAADGRLLVLLPALDLPTTAKPTGPKPTTAKLTTSKPTGPKHPTAKPTGPKRDVPEAEAMLEQAIAAIRQHLDPAARAGLGPVVPGVDRAADSARGAESVTSLESTEPVLSFGQARNRLLLRAVRDLLGQRAELLDPRVAELIARDPVSATTLLRYLDTGSDVGRVAAELAVHPTTVRYRLRRTGGALGMDLADPDDRLAIQLQLRHKLRSRPFAG